MITSPFSVGAVDIRWDNPQLLPQNSPLHLLGVNVYRSTDSPYGPYEKVNGVPVTVMFYRDQTIETQVIDEDATATIKHKFEPTNNGLDQWLVFSQNKPIVIPGSNGAYTTRISDVQVKIDDGDGNFLIMPAFAVDGVTGQIQLISAPVYNNDLNQIIPPRLPFPPNGRVRISYSYIKHQVLTVLNQRLYYKVATVAVDPQNPSDTIETPLEEISDRSPFDMESIDYIWREAILRNRYILEQGGERVMLFPRKWMGEQCPDHQVNYGQGYNDCHTCFPAGQWVTKSDGSKEDIKDIKENDTVLTSYGVSSRVTKIFCSEHKEDLIKIAPIGKDPILCTQDHLFLIIKKEETGCKRSNHLRDKCVPMTKGICFKGYNTNATDCQHRPETCWVSASDLKKGDYLIEPKIKKEEKYFSNDEMFLFGFYTAEGCVSLNGSKVLNRLRFGFGKEEIDIINTVKEVFERQYHVKMGFCKNKTQGNCYELWCCDKIIADSFIENCGRFAHEKCLSKKIVDSSKESIGWFLSGYVLGDGHVGGKREKKNYGSVYFSTVSHKLSSQIELLFIKLGSPVTLHYKYHNDKRPNKSGWIYLGQIPSVTTHCIPLLCRKKIYREIKKKQHRIFPFKDFICYPINETSKQKFSGPVYNIEVEGDHTYLVNNVAVHNCLGTSIIGGYLGPIQLMIAPPETEKSVELADMGLHIRYDWQSWTTNYPLLNPRDVIVRQNNERYVVGPVNPQGARGAIFQQHFTMSYIDQGDIRYSIGISGSENGPAPEWDRYRTEKPPTPASPEMPLKPTVDPAKIIRGRTVTFENISW
jgi:hypothetical protein